VGIQHTLAPNLQGFSVGQTNALLDGFGQRPETATKRSPSRAGKYFVNSKTGGDRLELSWRDLDALLDQLAAAA
jgi:hypothetical protein